MKLLTPAALLFLAMPVVLAQNAPSGSFAVTHVRLFDGERTLQDQTVVVKDGKIAAVGRNVAVPAGVPEIAGAGRTLLPGLIDAHVHAYPTNSLRESEALGVTTVLDMFNNPYLVKLDKAAENSGAGLAGADILSAGFLATVPKGHGTEYPMPVPTLTTPSEASAWVDARIAEGSDYIKIILEDGSAFGGTIPTLDRPTVDALVAATHKRHKMAVFHIGSYDEANEAIDAGADGLMHLFLDHVPGPDFGKSAAAHHIFVVPTLSVLLSATGTNDEAKSLAADKRMADYLPTDDLANLQKVFPTTVPLHYEATTESIRQLKAARVPILAGTDAPNPGTMFGASMHGELELLVKAGLSAEEALTAATSAPADCFSLADRGRVAAAKRADLLLVNGDPTVNITDTRNIVDVWKSGQMDDRAAYAAEIAMGRKTVPSGPPALEVGHGTISDFEDGTDHAKFGAGWSKSTDALYGGKSTTDYEVVSDGANGTKHSLKVSGNVAAGLPYAWAGAMFSPGATPFSPANLTKSSGIRFWAKGDGKTYRILFFTAGGGNIGQETTFVAGADWKQYEVPFSTFGGSDGHDVEAILFTSGPGPGKFSFQLDEVALTVKK